MTRGIHCPACHSEHTWVHGARVLPDGGLAWDFRCLNCQTVFVWRENECLTEVEAPATAAECLRATVRRIIARLER